MQIRTYQIVKTESHHIHPLNLKMSSISLQLIKISYSSVLQSYLWAVMSALTAYKHKYICNDPLTFIFIGQMSESH